MFDKLRKTTFAILALGALALGGATLANARDNGPAASPTVARDTASTQAEAPDTETDDDGQSQATGSAAGKVGDGEVPDAIETGGRP